MADITKSVGEGGFNLGHDVAMVQAMLGLVKNAKGHVYLPAHYDGSYGTQTRNALVAFQTDHGLGVAPYPGPPATPGPNQEAPGRAEPGGATIQKLNAILPATHTEIRIIEGTKVVYWPGAAVDALKHANKIGQDVNLEPDFRAKVAKLVNVMFDRHKIVLSSLFHAKFASMWEVRNKIAFNELGLFKSNLKGDLIHIQKFSDNNISMRNSLAHLLTQVGTMKWSHGPGGYACDLGGGGGQRCPGRRDAREIEGRLRRGGYTLDQMERQAVRGRGDDGGRGDD
jgi:hypothetical protein